MVSKSFACYNKLALCKSHTNCKSTSKLDDILLVIKEE